jgi:hypothetical protein
VSQKIDHSLDPEENPSYEYSLSQITYESHGSLLLSSIPPFHSIVASAIAFPHLVLVVVGVKLYPADTEETDF